MKIQIRLPENIIQYLIHSPESGMGYQKVNLILKNGRRITDVTVYNSSLAEIDEQINPETIAKAELIN
ncbi:MAG: hypothetical protein KBG21_11200 [Ignavibacteria bacterium]|nr:hypothetical protein [Ignavibacteria bacterium]